MSPFEDVKDDKTLNDWLHEIAFVTSTMSDPNEPLSFQKACWYPNLAKRLFAWNSRRCGTLVSMETCEKKRPSK